MAVEPMSTEDLKALIEAATAQMRALNSTLAMIERGAEEKADAMQMKYFEMAVGEGDVSKAGVLSNVSNWHRGIMNASDQMRQGLRESDKGLGFLRYTLWED